MDINWYLSENDFFKDIPKEWEAFKAVSNRIELAKNAFVFHQGDPGNSCFYVARGTLKIFRSTETGEEPIFFLRKKGQLFGLAEVIEQQDRSCSAQTISPTTIIEVKHKVILPQYCGLHVKPL